MQNMNKNNKYESKYHKYLNYYNINFNEVKLTKKQLKLHYFVNIFTQLQYYTTLYTPLRF